jgi:hypothetical protein
MTSSYDVGIDQLRLDHEWSNQPKRYLEAGEMLAEAKAALERERDAQKVYLAELRSSIRSNPERFGLAKVTEGAVEEVATCDGKYCQSQARIVDLKLEVDSIAAYVEALQHRKYALQDLVSLQLSGYSATPVARPADRETVSETTKRVKRQKLAREER